MRKTIARADFLASAALLASAASLLGTAANAADNGFYLGAGVGQTDVKVDEGIVQVDGDDTAFKVIAGFRPLDFFAVELNYIDFGNVEDSGFKVEGSAFTAYAVGFLPLGPVDLFANGTSNVYYDDMSLVPAPASLALTGLAGLFAARRRRA